MPRRRVLLAAATALLSALGFARCSSPERANVEKGQHALGQGRFQEAIAHYQEAILDAPRSSDAARALYEIGLIHYYRIRDLSAARATFRKLSTDYPDSRPAREARFMLARLYAEDLDAADKALEEYHALLESSESRSEEKAIRLAMAECQYQAGRLEHAAVAYRQIVDGYPYDESSGAAYLKLAHIERLLGRAPESVTIFDRLLELSPTADVRRAAFFGSAEALSQLGLGDRAKGYLERAVEEFPGDSEAKGRLSELSSRSRSEELLQAEAGLPENLERRVRWSRTKKPPSSDGPPRFR